ncbi:MAG: hypothetical protein WC376_04935 [Candidatus Nanoarchaeia archaeon]|jgi:hypothetical protein
MKTITPVISVILLVLITVVASVSAFFFINSNVLDLESQGSLDNYPGADNSRLNLVSITGSKAIIRNDGSSPVTEVVIFVNGELLNFTLDTPIQPGELREINYISQEVGEDLEIKVIYNNGKITQATSPASKNTENNGFDSNLTLFFNSCPVGSEVVNLEDKRTGWLSTDSHTCGCSIISTTNILLNGDFENGNNSWVIIAGQAGAFADEIYEGDYSIGEYSDYDSGVTISSVAQLVNGTVDSINLHAFYNSSSTGQGYSGIFVYYSSETPGYSKTLAYIINGSGDIFSNCNSTQGNFFIDCSYNITSDSWQSINITGIYNQFIDKFPDADTSEGVTSIVLWTQALSSGSSIISHYDTLVALLNNNDGKYCENSNFYNYAQGVCYNNTCIKTYINNFVFNTTFLINENPNILVNIINFNSSAKCNLNLNNTNYPMDISSNLANYSLSNPLGKGIYLVNVTCDNDVFLSKTSNITSGILKKLWTVNVNTDIDESYNVVGEINSSSDGKEIVAILYDEKSINIYSSLGEYINNISLSNNKLIYPPTCGNDQKIESLAIADINNDLENEIVVKDCNNIYLFNNTLDRVWNYTYSFSDGGIAVADINESAGLELLANSFCDLIVLNSTGGLLWTYDKGTGGCSTAYLSSKQSPVVANINLENPGPEILTVDHQNALVMLNSNGQEMYSFNISEIGLHVSPSVAELNDSNPGLETVYITNSSAINMSIYLLNSTLSPIWSYNFTWDDGSLNYDYMNIPKHIAIGDVNGDGENEIIVSFVNTSNWDPYDINDHILILDNNGSLITDYVTMAHGGFNPILLELDSSNNGLEIVSPETNYFRVLNYTGGILYEISASYASGPTVIADDIDGDTFLELLSFESGGNLIKRYDSYISSTNNVWPIYKHDLNQTGYQG